MGLAEPGLYYHPLRGYHLHTNLAVFVKVAERRIGVPKTTCKKEDTLDMLSAGFCESSNEFGLKVIDINKAKRRECDINSDKALYARAKY